MVCQVITRLRKIVIESKNDPTPLAIPVTASAAAVGALQRKYARNKPITQIIHLGILFLLRFMDWCSG